MQLNWEEAHSCALREYLDKGMSFSEAAFALNERFGTAYTRNAAIGRARRMGLSSPERAERPGEPRLPRTPKPSAARLFKLRERAALRAPPRSDIDQRAAALQLRCVAITPRHLSLIDLETNDCRYPYGGEVEGEPITFCGHPRRDGSSYCVSHFHLTRIEVAPARPAPKAALRLVAA